MRSELVDIKIEDCGVKEKDDGNYLQVIRI
jgi:hypothetical protein